MIWCIVSFFAGGLVVLGFAALGMSSDQDDQADLNLRNNYHR